MIKKKAPEDLKVFQSLYFLSSILPKPVFHSTYSSKALICFFGVTPSDFRLSTLRITLPVPS